MSKKTYKLVVGVCGGITSIIGAVVAYIDVNNTPAIIAAVGVVNTAITEVCSLFVVPEVKDA